MSYLMKGCCKTCSLFQIAIQRGLLGELKVGENYTSIFIILLSETSHPPPPHPTPHTQKKRGGEFVEYHMYNFIKEQLKEK